MQLVLWLKNCCRDEVCGGKILIYLCLCGGLIAVGVV